MDECSLCGEYCRCYMYIPCIDCYKDRYNCRCCHECHHYRMYSYKYCKRCGNVFDESSYEVATVAESSYEVVANTIKEAVNPLIEYIDESGGKFEGSAQIGNRKISASYTQGDSEILCIPEYINTYECTDTYESSDTYEPSYIYEPSDTEPSDTYECSDTTVAKSSSISVGELANIINNSAEATVEYAKCNSNSNVKMTTQIDDIIITTSYTPYTPEKEIFSLEE